MTPIPQLNLLRWAVVFILLSGALLYGMSFSHQGSYKICDHVCHLSQCGCTETCPRDRSR